MDHGVWELTFQSFGNRNFLFLGRPFKNIRIALDAWLARMFGLIGFAEFVAIDIGDIAGIARLVKHS